MDRQKIIRIASIIVGAILSILVLVVGFSLVQRYFAGATGSAPHDVIVSDITQNSANVKWTTDTETQGLIEYGTSPTSLGLTVPETIRSKDHSVDLTLLSSQTTYYFQILIGDKRYDNGGVPWQFSTKGTEQPTVPLLPIASPTSAAASPTPYDVLDTGSADSNVVLTCDETDCNKIKEKLGSGCSTKDYFECKNKITPTP